MRNIGLTGKQAIDVVHLLTWALDMIDEMEGSDQLGGESNEEFELLEPLCGSARELIDQLKGK